MVILGVGGSDHDIASCIIADGKLRVAIEEERVSRKKYALGSNLLFGLSRKYCLDVMGLRLEEVDKVIGDDCLAETACYGLRKRIEKINHHLAHASSVYYPSPFSESAVLVIDNAGSLIVDDEGKQGVETISYFYGENTELNLLRSISGSNWNEGIIGTGDQVYQRGDSDDSLGHFYKIVSGKLGFGFYVKDGFYYPEAGKTMGLAPYGNDCYYSDMREFVKCKENGRVEIALSNGRFEQFLDDILLSDGQREKKFACKASIAFAAQKLLEESILFCADHLYQMTKSKNLCFSGGVALNCVSNGRMVKELPFESVYLFPACGDNGTAIGCAYFGLHKYSDHPKNTVNYPTPYFGKVYVENDIKQSLDEMSGLVYSRTDNPAKQAAQFLANGLIIGWFQEGSEFGPRALGHRSILADARNPDIKDIINSRIKFREGFRPFAPSILFDEMGNYFDEVVESPYMLFAFAIKKEMRNIIPGVVHVDGTARLQTVKDETNGLYASLIREFYRITGVPLVLNTSFNVKGEPIVETPQDALNCFLKTDLDVLVIGNYIVKKQKNKDVLHDQQPCNSSCSTSKLSTP